MYAMPTSPFTHPALVPHQGDAQTDVLRLLGRLHVVVTPNIEALIYSRSANRSARCTAT
jgi:hypothetical protein